jgi:hypothetical protein
MGTSYDQFAHDKEKTLQKYWLTMEDATAKLLRQHWKEVTAVAEELLVHNTLSGKEVVEVIEANQTEEALRENIIPKTLAAIRAQALAEIRNGKSGGQLLNEPIPLDPQLNAAAAGSTPAGETVIVINGTGNGARQPVTPSNGDSNTSNADGPTLVEGGMGDYQPPIVGGNEGAPPPEEQK